MRFYSEHIFPCLLDLVMSNRRIQAIRHELLAPVCGKVLEIGFGTGLNLPHYPSSVESITTVDVNPGMSRRAHQRIAASNIAVDLRVLNGERLPMDDAQFDSVVCTWTLCSINAAEQALQEMKRALKPGGRFFFVEHGLHQRPTIRKWQHRLTPIQKIVADGCRLNRDIGDLIRAQNFATVDIKEYELRHVPKIGGYMYQGIAIK